MKIRFIAQPFLVLLLTFVVISCPSPKTKEIVIATIPEVELLCEANRVSLDRPKYALNLLKKITSSQFSTEKVRLLLKIYLDQREYGKALLLVDSIRNVADISTDKTINDYACRVFLKTKRWEEIPGKTEDNLLKGVALYNLKQYIEAIECLSQVSVLKDYTLLLTAKCYYGLNDFANALHTTLSIDSISPYLSAEYQNFLFDLLLSSTEINLVKRELPKIKDPISRKYLMLKLYEHQQNKKELRALALDLINNHPSSAGAKYSINIVKPLTPSEYKAFGRVAYLHKDYTRAMKFFMNAPKDGEINYYMGKINYDQQQYGNALIYFEKSRRTEAYYYRGLIYENREDYRRAIAVYDSLINLYQSSKFAIRAMKRKAFLLEDIGDTLNAIETFVKVKEKNTSFRAGFQLFRIGQLARALEIFKNYPEPDFVYWQIRTKERLGEPVDSLKHYLYMNFPLSYYTLVSSKSEFIFDTMSLDCWLKQFGDTSVTFDCEDSAHINRAIQYFAIDESKYAIAELELIEDRSFMDLIHLSRLCAENGSDYGAIKFCLQLKKRYEKNSDSRNYPVEFLRLLYPAKYVFSITDCHSDLWLILAMIWQESMFDPMATSSANAQGLMQVIPKTGKLLATELGIQSYSLYDPQISIKFGTTYINKMLNEFFHLPLALAAYNAGPISVKRWLNKNRNAEMDEFIELIPYSETRDYVRLTLARKLIYQKIWGHIVE